MPIKILNTPACVVGYQSEIVDLADSNKEALGFLPQGMYKNQIHKGAVFVAVDEKGGESRFAGHILLGGRYPAKRVFQLVVKPEYHGQGVGKKLLKAAEAAAKSEGFSSIWAKVGSKLPANKFWQKQGLDVIGEQRGGMSHPICYIREKQLAPSLFDYKEAGRGTLAALRQTIENIPAELAFIVDTNVYIDAVRGKEKHARFVFDLEKREKIQIARIPAITKELEKRDDAVLKYARQFPELNIRHDESVADELRDIVFPDKRRLEASDKSDLQFLSAAIAGKANFVTRDKKILQNAKTIYDRYSLNIWSPGDLWDWEIHPRRIESKVVSAAPEPRDSFRFADNPDKAQLKKAGFNRATAKKYFWRTALMDNGNMLGVVAAEESASQVHNISLFLRDDKARAEHTAEILLGLLREQVIPTNIQLTLHSDNDAGEKGVFSHGYIKTGQNAYKKTHAPRVVMTKNWGDYRDTLNRLCGVKIPEDIPEFSGYDQPIRIGSGANVPLDRLENYLSSVFILPGRDGVVVPIKPQFADMFFKHARQRPLSVLPSPIAALLAQKSYLGKTAVSQMKPGMLVLFYQKDSKDARGAIVAVARVVRTQSIDPQNISASEKRRLVLSAAYIEKMRPPVMETVFDNVVVFPNPVTLDTLKRINCHHKAGFVTATYRTHSQVFKILKEGGFA